MSLSRCLPLLAVLALAVPSASAGQIKLIPQVGLYAPATELPSPSEGVRLGERESSLAYGAALEFGPGLRIGVVHATDGEVPIDGVGCTDCARSTVTAATATLVIRPLPELGFVRPYLLLGGGVKRYDFTREDLGDEGLEAVLSDSNEATGQVGLATEIDLGFVRANVELQDLISRFGNGTDDDGFQHDFFLMVGLVLGG